MASFSVSGRVQVQGNQATLTLDLPKDDAPEVEVTMCRPKIEDIMAKIVAGRGRAKKCLKKFCKRESPCHALNPQTWTKHKTHLLCKVLARVKVHVDCVKKHPTRLPLANQQITNMTLPLRLQCGAAGEWHVRAELLLASAFLPLLSGSLPRNGLRRVRSQELFLSACGWLYADIYTRAAMVKCLAWQLFQMVSCFDLSCFPALSLSQQVFHASYNASSACFSKNMF